MKASKLIAYLQQQIAEHGDLEMAIEVGELSSAELVTGVDVVPADIKHNPNGEATSIYVPWNANRITNGQIFILKEW